MHYEPGIDCGEHLRSMSVPISTVVTRRGYAPANERAKL